VCAGSSSIRPGWRWWVQQNRDKLDTRHLLLLCRATQIRQYPVEERKELGDTQSSAWQDTFSKVRVAGQQRHRSNSTPTKAHTHLPASLCLDHTQYLQDVDCPLSLEPGGSNTQAVLQWLLNYAVSLEYADAGETIAKAEVVSSSTRFSCIADTPQRHAPMCGK
jgi:hypothetical protein